MSIDPSQSPVTRTRIAWRDEYLVGVEEVDRQHRHLFELLRQQIEQHHSDGDEKEAGKILDELVEYAKLHFRTEEKYFQNHPDFAQHQEVHAAFVRDLMVFYRRYANGVASVRDELITYMAMWLVDHVVGIDRRYFAELKMTETAAIGPMQS